MLVRAHNSHGTSQPSPVSDYIETLGRASSPSQGWTDDEIKSNMANTTADLVSLDVLSSTAVNVTWQVGDLTAHYVFLVII